MRSILTLSQEERGQEWCTYLQAARRQVEEARRCVENFEEPDRAENVERLAGNLAKLFVRDMLAKEERCYSDASGAEPSRDGFHGYTWAISVPDLLSFLQIQAKTGTLRVNIGSEVISLVLVEGDLVHAFSDNSPPGLRLGEILVEQGHLQLDDLQGFLVDFSSGTERLGDALERKGLITHEQLEGALEFQIRLIFVRLLCSPKAYFRFHAGRNEEESPLSRYSVMSLLLDACRIQDEAKDSSEGESSEMVERAVRESD
ncbi:MAG: DUF4388 domain-containing protein [Planctomycetota bacterium]